MRRGGVLTYLHSDHLSSNTLVTNADGTYHSSQNYCAYGGKRTATWYGSECDPTAANPLPTDRTYTGQEQDTTGLMFYHARFYDPALGTFISPDTVVPQPGVVADYNRFAYVRSNPLKYTDPTGHVACEQSDTQCWERRWYLARGYRSINGEWKKGYTPTFLDEGAAIEYMLDAAINQAGSSAGYGVTYLPDDAYIYHMNSGLLDYLEEIGDYLGFAADVIGLAGAFANPALAVLGVVGLAAAGASYHGPGNGVDVYYWGVKNKNNRGQSEAAWTFATENRQSGVYFGWMGTVSFVHYQLKGAANLNSPPAPFDFTNKGLKDKAAKALTVYDSIVLSIDWYIAVSNAIGQNGGN